MNSLLHDGNEMNTIWASPNVIVCTIEYKVWVETEQGLYFVAASSVHETETVLRKHFNGDPKLNANLRKPKKLAVTQ